MSANKAETLDELRALQEHYAFRVVRDTSAEERFWRDYLEDLHGFDMDAIRGGCRKWRQSGAKKFPTSGELLPMVRASVVVEQRTAAEQPWKPLSDADYERLTLPEKIRHHRILAMQARRKAGPMWTDGRPATADQLSDTWREWTKRAAGHEDEAARLSRYLYRQPIAVEQS